MFFSRYMERDDLMKFLKKNFSISFLKNLFSRYILIQMQVGRISLLAYACVFMHTVVDGWYLQICTTIAIFFVNRPLCVLHELQITVTTLGLSVLISSMTFAVIKITENKYYSIWKKTQQSDLLIFWFSLKFYHLS